MDIHAPERPIDSFKDFALHIAIVTIGILIALGLEGIRETIHEHRLVRETRENFRHELQVDLETADRELQQVTKAEKSLQQIIALLPTVGKQHPELIGHGVEQVEDPYYFFTANAWQAALSTGALAHMSTEEVSTFASSSEIIHIYTNLQVTTMAAQNRALTFFQAHPNPTPSEMEEGTERLLEFARDQHGLVYVGGQLRQGIKEGLDMASRK